jgi:putative tryptophan/tyrosine transport system substrate-binding protein
MHAPEGNLTGFTSFEAGVGGKWLDILKEIAPRVSRVTVLFYPETPAYVALWHWVEAAAAPLAIKANAAGVHDAAKIEQAIAMVAGQADSGLVVRPTPVTNGNHALIADLAARHHLPAVYPWRFYATSGGLASYAPDNLDLYRRAASYVNRILRGEKPADAACFAANVKSFFLAMKKNQKNRETRLLTPKPLSPTSPRAGAGAGGRVPANRFDNRGE